MELYEIPGKRARAFEELRFNELENFEARIFDDGRIFPEEAQAATRLLNDVKAEFLVVGDIVRQMEQTKDPRLGAAKAMWRHVNRCLIVIERIESKARAERARTDYGESLKRHHADLIRRENSEKENEIIMDFLKGRSNKDMQTQFGELFTNSEARMNARFDAMGNILNNMPTTERASLKDKALQLIGWLHGLGNVKQAADKLKQMAVSFKQRTQRTT